MDAHNQVADRMLGLMIRLSFMSKSIAEIFSICIQLILVLYLFLEIKKFARAV